MSDTVPDDNAVSAVIRALTAARGKSGSICPSEVARALASGEDAWRALMPDVRRVAAALADAGEIVATQRGAPVDPRTARGAIRLGLNPSAPSPSASASPPPATGRRRR